MIDFVYDGSFDGFLSAASLALKEQGARVVPFACHAADLFADAVNVPTDDEAAGRMRRRIGSCAGTDELDTLLLVHSSASPDRHRLLLSYIRLTLRAGRSVAAEIIRPDVLAVRKIRDRVSLEMAKLLGFVRFRRAGGNLSYAPVRPDADIVGLIGPHFAERFPDQAVVVHDLERGIAFWADRGASGIVELTGLPAELSDRLSIDCDSDVEQLWRTYFTRIANPERRNPRLQRKLMPARYWDLLVERPGGSWRSR
jgi:probable DNA metabolism protein